jgi:hypothetical protein
MRARTRYQEHASWRSYVCPMSEIIKLAHGSRVVSDVAGFKLLELPEPSNCVFDRLSSAVSVKGKFSLEGCSGSRFRFGSGNLASFPSNLLRILLSVPGKFVLRTDMITSRLPILHLVPHTVVHAHHESCRYHWRW